MLKNRDGVTLVLTLFFFTVMMGVAALSIDMSSMYVARTQLQSAADASALAGAIGVGNGEGAAASTAVTTYLGKNQVNGITATVDSVSAGLWDGSYHAGNWTDANANSVKLHLSYTAPYMFGRIFGKSNQPLHATAIAVHGGVTGQNCVRPWAIPYQTVLDKLGPGKTSSYNLTKADLVTLSNVMGSAANAVTFEGVRLPPGEYNDVAHTAGGDIPGGNAYRNEIGFHTCAELDDYLKTASPAPPSVFVSVGDWLKEETGVKNGPTKQGIDALCGGENCSPHYPVVVALYKPAANAPGGHCNGCWQVKYMATFMLVGYDKSSKSPIGYFRDTVATMGGFTPSVMPISKNALVK